MSSERTSTVALTVLVATSIAMCAWFAGARPDGRRAWDERYSMRNVEWALRLGRIRPVSPYYPNLAHLPQMAVLGASEALSRVSGVDGLAVLRPRQGITATGYRLARWTNVAFGAACLILTFALARRLFGEPVALLAALLMAVSPWFIRSAGIFKPDVLSLLFFLATFLWALRAVERKTLGSYLLGGLGVGLAASAKQTGVLACLPLIGATLARYRQPRAWLHLAAAGVLSLALFLALHPFPEDLAKYIWQIEGYQAWAEGSEARAPRDPTLVFIPSMILHPSWHGRIVGLAALAGIAGLAVVWLRARGRREGSVELALFVSFVPAYSLICALVSDYPKTNIFVPILPFTSIAAAWTIHGVWRLVRGRLPPLRQRWAAAAGVGALLAIAAWGLPGYLYGEAVPETTLHSAAERIKRHLSFLEQRTVHYEEGVGELEIERYWREGEGDGEEDSTQNHQVTVRAVPHPTLAELAQETLDLADYEVFPEARLHGPTRGFYFGRLTRPNLQAIELLDEPWYRRRGPAQLVLIHPWSPKGRALPVEWKERPRARSRIFRGWVPAPLRRGEVVSLDLKLTERRPEDCTLSFGEAPVEMIPYYRKNGTLVTMSRRFVLPSTEVPIVLRCGKPREGEIEPLLSFWLWSPDPPRSGRKRR